MCFKTKVIIQWLSIFMFAISAFREISVCVEKGY